MVDEPTPKKPRYEQIKVDIQEISGISKDDVLKTAERRIADCKRAILNSKTSAEGKEIYKKAIPLIKKAQKHILAALNEDREDNLKALAASNDYMIQHILKQIVKYKIDKEIDKEIKEKGIERSNEIKEERKKRDEEIGDEDVTKKFRSKNGIMARKLLDNSGPQDIGSSSFNYKKLTRDLRSTSNELGIVEIMEVEQSKIMDFFEQHRMGSMVDAFKEYYCNTVAKSLKNHQEKYASLLKEREQIVDDLIQKAQDLR